MKAMSKWKWYPVVGPYFSLLKKVFGSVGSKGSSVLDGISEALKSYISQETGMAMTGAQKETMDYQGEWNNRLAEADYQRKQEFYEKYESYGAQVRQMQDAGLNPALMYGNGASVSASGGVGSGSVSAPSAGSSEILGALINLGLRSAQMKQEKDLREQQMAIDSEKNKSYQRYLDAMSRGQEISNEFRAAQESAKLENIAQNTALLQEKVKTEEVSRRLMESGISQNEADAALKLRQAVLLEIEANHKDEYLRLQNDYQALVNDLQRTTNPLVARHLSAQIREINAHADKLMEEAALVVLERDGQAITNGLLAKDFNTWDKAYKRNAAQSWIRTGASVVGAAAGVAGAGAAVGKLLQPAATVVNNLPGTGLVGPPSGMTVGSAGNLTRVW